MMRLPASPRTRVLYVYGTLLVFLFIMGFLWLVMSAVVVPMQTAIASNMAQYDTANSTYPAYTTSTTFLTNLWTYLLVVAVIGVAYWAWIYSQRKNVEAGY